MFENPHHGDKAKQNLTPVHPPLCPRLHYLLPWHWAISSNTPLRFEGRTYSSFFPPMSRLRFLCESGERGKGRMEQVPGSPTQECLLLPRSELGGRSRGQKDKVALSGVDGSSPFPSGGGRFSLRPQEGHTCCSQDQQSASTPIPLPASFPLVRAPSLRISCSAETS